MTSTQPRSERRSTFVVAALVIVTLVALTIFGFATGVLGPLLGFGPKSPTAMLDAALEQRREQLVDQVVQEIAETRDENAPSVEELSATLRSERTVVADLNSDGRDDELRVLSMQDGPVRDYFALASVTADDGDPTVLPATFLGCDLHIDSAEAEAAEITIAGTTTAATSASKPATPQALNRTSFTETIRLSDARLELSIDAGDTATEHPATITPTPLDELGPSTRIDHPKSHVTGTLRFGELAVIQAHVPDTHTLKIVDANRDRPHPLTIMSVDPDGTAHTVADDGTVDCTGDAYLVLASDRATVTSYDLTVEIVPKPLPISPGDDVMFPTHDEQGRPIVYFTFDDGPSPYTSQVLEILERHKATATFFMIGSQAAADPALVQRVRDGGHGIGNHTWSHPDLTTLKTNEVSHEITRTDGPLGDTQCVRPPYGATNDQVRGEIEALGKTQQLWTVDSLDWSQPGVANIEANIMGPIAPGAVVLMHDGGGSREQSVEALENVLTKLDSAGYVVRALPNC